MAKKIFNFTGRAAVWLAAFVVILFMTTEAIDNIVKVINPNITVFKGNVPMEIVSWFWCAIIGSYTTGYQFFQVLETRKMPEGKISLGDTERLKKVIFCALFIAVYGLFLNVTFGAEIGLEGLITAFMVDVLCFIIGRRAIETQKYVDTSEEDECDINGDGIVDWQDVKEIYTKKGLTISDDEAKKILIDFIKDLKKNISGEK